MERGFGFTLRHLPELFSPLVLRAIGLVLGAIEWGLFFLSRVPIAGDIALGCLFMPLMIVNLALISLFAMIWWLTPGIVAIEQGDFAATLAALR